MRVIYPTVAFIQAALVIAGRLIPLDINSGTIISKRSTQLNSRGLNGFVVLTTIITILFINH